MAERAGLLNRCTSLNLYRGFESLPLRRSLHDRQAFIMAREVAQAGSAPGLGPGGRRFESCLPDNQFFGKYISRRSLICGFFVYNTGVKRLVCMAWERENEILGV